MACQLPSKGAAQIIAQTDGCLVPIVKSQGKAGIIDKRKTRELVWQEARLSLARRCGVLNKHYQATLLGVEKAGKQLFDCAVKAGAGEPSSIHCVGDGATWIVRQVEAQFGRQASYLLDYYHLSEYLWKAAEGLSRKPVKWLHQQQERLKKNQAEKVLKALVGGVESAEIAEGEAPVRACWRYLSNRLEYVNYQGALEADLPIGSGEIESGNRSVIQGRLKIPGAWWKQENAEVMLALRAQRASGQWQSYWANLRQAAA